MVVILTTGLAMVERGRDGVCLLFVAVGHIELLGCRGDSAENGFPDERGAMDEIAVAVSLLGMIDELNRGVNSVAPFEGVVAMAEQAVEVIELLRVVGRPRAMAVEL